MFKSLLLSCPHHHQANEVLEPNTQILLNSAAGGQALEKTYAEMFTLLNRISQGNPEWNGGGAKPVVQKSAGVLEMDAVTTLTAQISAMHNIMTTLFSNMSLGHQQAQVNMVQQPPTWCDVCGGGDHTAEQGHGNQQASKQGDMSVEDILKQIMADQAKLEADVRNNQLAIQNLEKQFGQFASAQNCRPQGGLPGFTDPNPKHVNVVSTRSGHPLEELTPKAKAAEEKGKHVDEVEPSEQRGIPKYDKYVKDVVANKSRLAEYAKVAVTEECSSRIQNRLPTKLKDPGSFTVQIKIARLDGVIEDVLVQVGTLIFPIDFVILFFEPDPEVPFILGRPFLATGGALIDVAAGRLTMRAHDKVEVFDVYKAMKLPAIYDKLLAITVIDEEMASKYVEAR
ncbi:uncharacterized protein [Solanum tuberosum]|uniref:uncharacterized protein n=1 Tax=Solanum tuberosum TaxID=4113 RepID=UPI00073A048F|nr:PREDICTED: uncharacterized protein LOC107062971 [Solanum tuberosum]